MFVSGQTKTSAWYHREVFVCPRTNKILPVVSFWISFCVWQIQKTCQIGGGEKSWSQDKQKAPGGIPPGGFCLSRESYYRKLSKRAQITHFLSPGGLLVCHLGMQNFLYKTCSQHQKITTPAVSPKLVEHWSKIQLGLRIFLSQHHPLHRGLGFS